MQQPEFQKRFEAIKYSNLHSPEAAIMALTELRKDRSLELEQYVLIDSALSMQYAKADCLPNARIIIKDALDKVGYIDSHKDIESQRVIAEAFYTGATIGTLSVLDGDDDQRQWARHNLSRGEDYLSRSIRHRAEQGDTLPDQLKVMWFAKSCMMRRFLDGSHISSRLGFIADVREARELAGKCETAQVYGNAKHITPAQRELLQKETQLDVKALGSYLLADQFGLHGLSKSILKRRLR